MNFPARNKNGANRGSTTSASSYGSVTLNPNKEKPVKRKATEYAFNFDLDEMEKAIQSPSITVPKGLSRDQFKTWIKSRAK